MSTGYQYEVNLQWESEWKGTLSSPVLAAQTEVATAPKFQKGLAGIGSHEHLILHQSALA